MDYLDVPVIDFSNAYSEKINERFKLAEEIGNVVTNIGFLVLSNHGVKKLNNRFLPSFHSQLI